MSSWERGYGDFQMKPDLDDAAPDAVAPGHRAADGGPAVGTTARDVVASPRQILRRQLDRLAERGLTANAGTELEFIVFRTPYEEAWKRGYRGLEPANLYNIDYSLLGAARVEPLIRRIRNEMAGAGMTVENSKGECNLGQHEINFRYGDALRDRRRARDLQERAPRRSPRRRACRSRSWRSGTSARATPATSTARSRDEDGGNAFADDHQMFDRFVAGQLACLRELTLLYAPHINSYKRFVRGLVRADGGRVGQRQPHLLDARRRPRPGSLRVENRLPGADVNPYLALAAMIAAGLHGIDSELELGAAVRGQRLRRPTSRACRTNMYDARDLFADSEVAREAFGQEVVDHYLNRARVEIEAFEAAVTDWERFRGFERL